MSEETDDADVPDTPESDTELRTDGGQAAAANPSASRPSTETGPAAPAGPTGPGQDSPNTEAVDPNLSNANFETSCVRLLGGHRVIVESAKGHRFEGVLDQFDLEERHVLLTDAQESPSGASYDRVFVAEVDWIVLAGRHE